jgi:hypothetical protein
MKLNLILLITLIFMLVSSCNSGQLTSTLSTEELFTISLGKMEDQFDFFVNNNTPFMGINKHYLDEKLFYIVNGNANKVMQYSPFGYLMLLLYNPQFNTVPVLLKKDDPDQTKKISNRKAVAYPFNELGAIAVDMNKNMFIQDKVPESQYIKENGVVYTNVIKIFSQNGDINKAKEGNDFWIGKEGVGGSPFSYIDNIYITSNNELVVVTRTTLGWYIYWFDSQYNLLYEVEIDLSNIPVPINTDYIPLLEKIVPDYHNHMLYVMISYSKRIIDKLTNTVAKVKNIESRIFKLDLVKEAYDENSIIIPNDELREEQLFEEKKELDISLYEFLGVSESGYFFFAKMKDATTYFLQILDAQGKTIRKSKFQIDDTDLVFIDFNISKQGILSALIGETSQVRIVWWRSDKIIEQHGNENS